MKSESNKVSIKEDLLAIKDEILKPVKRKNRKDEIKQINSQLEDLSKKVDDLQETLSSSGSSSTKLRKKKEVVYYIKKNEKVTTTELSEKMDLSRTRCSEYLNEMKREGILTSEKKGKKKYYMLDL